MFESFTKIPRLNKEVVVTEKIDGTNAQVHIVHYDDAYYDWSWDNVPEGQVLAQSKDKELYMFAGSRNRYLTLEDDNFGFAAWVATNADELFKFGPGRHYGEWWGQGIQRTYDLDEKRFTMFNPRWADQGPSCVDSTPILDTLDTIDTQAILWIMQGLEGQGSQAAPGFMDPEGIVIYHSGSRQLFKQTFDFDEGKWNDK